MNRPARPLIGFALVALAALACGLTSELSPTVAPATLSPNTPGATRTNPLPAGSTLQAPGWEISLLETVHGDSAERMILDANMFNDPAPEGYAYLLAYIRATSTHADNQAHTIDAASFDLTGSAFELYSAPQIGQVLPEPALRAELRRGETAEGWVGFLVRAGESAFVLVYDDIETYDEGNTRYLALGDDIPQIPDDVFAALPSGRGADIREPAEMGDTLVTPDWELTVTRAIRGDRAWNMIYEANPYNEPPEDGMDYVVIYAEMRYLGEQDDWATLGGYHFVFVNDANEDFGANYAIEPDPILEGRFYPGAEFEGWAALQVPKNQEVPLLRFTPGFSWEDHNTRYIRLDFER